jgi:hypothetical protein
VEECPPVTLAALTKVIVNGLWVGVLEDPIGSVEKFKLFRRNALIPIYFSISFDIKQNTIFIYTDAGRLTRPIFYRDLETGKFSFENPEIIKKIESDEFSWSDLIAGFNTRKEEANFHPNTIRMYSLSELYQGITSESNPAKLERFMSNKAIIDYIDTSESEDTLIALNQEVLEDSSKKYTHMEIHESLMLSMMCNLIAFPENNPATRNSFSCGQSKQAVSMYHTNHRMRMDKSAVVLNNAQIPLVKTRYMEYINGEDNCYGENTIVAIMCYTGYNVEDAILVNEGSLKRGMFKTTYYSTYENHEEKKTNGDLVSQSTFSNIENSTNVVGTKQGYDYSQLDEYGLIREGTPVTDKTVLIGMTTSATGVISNVDASKTPKKGQLGIVDKTFITEGEEGTRIAKVRIREERIPAIGDKMASRVGQKGTIGLVIPESDMPFTKDGLRPDLIINPHAIPSRMTIGQFVEAIVGKAAAIYGGFADCTAFNNKGSKITRFGEMLSQMGYHSSGNDVLYNGMTGEQIETEVFIGPTYYMRLKHMVKDKINYRALGPRTALTRQPVEGRANDGGLRIGEMERDAIISHGAANFLTESMMERGDKYYMAICNKTGMIAVYNPANNLFMSPMADGPIKYIGSLAGDNLQIQNVTKYGRSFSVVCIPYSMKLLIHELQCINIQMRVITEDNIEQIENMSYSKNIEKLLQTKGATITDVAPLIRKSLGQVTIVKEPEKETFNPYESEEDKEEEEQINENKICLTLPKNYKPGMPIYPDRSPQFDPNSSQFDPNSPQFDPNSSQFDPNSPQFDPNSSQFDPNGSPQFAPDGSPQYASNTYPAYASNTSPAFASPYAPDSVYYGGQATEEKAKEYTVGDSVIVRGEIPDPRDDWKVSNTTSDFITIENNNPNTVSDRIRVVEPHQIMPYQPMMYSYQQEMPSQSPYQEQMHQPPNYMGGPPNINVAPIIKIVNGDDKSSAPMIDTEDTSSRIPYANTNTESNFVIKNPEKIESNQNGGENNKIDFSKLLIVKKT